MTETTITSLQHEIDQIKSRNHRVELEKKWETSFARKAALAVITYVILGAYMYLIGAERRYLDALVPTAGFVIGTWGMNRAKNMRIRNHK